MELESDLAKELFNKVILPIQAKNIDSKKTYQNIPVKQDNKEQEKTHREALLRLNEKHKREIKEKQKEMKKTQELEKRRQELEDLNKITQSEPSLPEPPAPDSPPAIETPAIQTLPAPPAPALPVIEAPAIQALPAPPAPTLPAIEAPAPLEIETPSIQTLPAPPAIETPAIQALPAPPAIETPAIQALPAPPSPTLPEIDTPTIQTPTLPALPPPEIKVNNEELLSENNIDNLLTILRKTLSQKQDESENIIERDVNELVITPSDDNNLIGPVNNSEVEPGTLSQKQDETENINELVRPQLDDNKLVEPINKTDDLVVSKLSSAAAPASEPQSGPEPAPTPAVVTSCDDEDCQEPINTSQSQQDISLTPQDLSEEVPITNLTQKIPELNIGDKMSWISQALAALFSTIGNLFTFEPVQDNDPYVNEEKEKQGYVYVGKMYMKPEDETKRPEKVKYINYNPTEKDFYIDEREEVKE